ncbi:hypothetical protein [Mesonia maritima]|uniref:Lipid/polyisoprenoid-binding YceI-like domain-containing protein n=1 Tax=Mesonia maritima TaxID=1793873 RepID=A0ABU1K1V7_9FLAO|nr:hypothetical protein [Mesonia maritima]MDR6299609.1 hypothetical protein [Mesonia maritima]
MKTLKSTLMALLVISVFSCSKDDDGPNPDNPDDNGESSYTITVNGTEYSNSWDSEGDSGGQSLFSTYTENSAGNKALSLFLSDEENTVAIEADLTLKNNGQPYQISNSPEGWDEDSEFSSVIILIGDKDYGGVSGTVTIANLKTKNITGEAGTATYDLELEGSFDDLNSEEEGVQVTVTFHIQPNHIE